MHLFEARWLYRNNPEVLTAPLADPFIQQVLCVFNEQDHFTSEENFVFTILDPEHNKPDVARARAVKEVLRSSRKERRVIIADPDKYMRCFRAAAGPGYSAQRAVEIAAAEKVAEERT
jgi:hypothetical protein